MNVQYLFNPRLLIQCDGHCTYALCQKSHKLSLSLVNCVEHYTVQYYLYVMLQKCIRAMCVCDALPYLVNPSILRDPPPQLLTDGHASTPLIRHHLPIRRIRPCHSRQLRLPLIPIRQQLLLVIQQLLPRLRSILRIRALHNGIYRAALLAETAVNAFRHVDVVARGSPGAVGTFLGFDSDGLRGTDGFAKFARDAPLFACGVAAQGVFAAEAWGDGSLFEGVVNCVTGLELVMRP